MKHKFTGQICVYCNDAPSETSDHALGRKFFLEERRGDLPQVPACFNCNNEKAKHEAYLMTVDGWPALSNSSDEWDQPLTAEAEAQWVPRSCVLCKGGYDAACSAFSFASACSLR